MAAEVNRQGASIRRVHACEIGIQVGFTVEGSGFRFAFLWT